jgi:hypothetical protein
MMKKVLFNTIVFLILIFLPMHGLYADNEAIEYINGMTLPEKIGQIMLIGFQGKTLSSTDMTHLKKINPGGIGGDGIAAAHGSTYGSVSAPTALGSGGAYNWSGVDTYGGTGAGAIKLVVSNTLTVDGTVSADGDRYIGGRTGGGSGGSVWVITDTLAGAGSIAADGGIGYATLKASLAASLLVSQAAGL